MKPIWTFVNPQGDAIDPVIQGSFTGDSKVAITVPGGSSHELLNGNIGAPYIIQSAANTDFTVVVKFDSVMPATNFAEQGIIVRESDSRWLRLEYYTQDNNTVTALAANGDPTTTFYYTDQTLTGLAADTSPLYMKIQRVGNTWTQSWSTDSTTYTDLPSFDYTMNVTGVGLYAGNALGTNAPEHTVLADYFSISTDPIIEPDDTGTNSLTTNVVGNGTLTPNPDLAIYACNDMVELTATPDAGWQFTGWSGDLTGNTNPATIEMSYAKSITANFSILGPPLAQDDTAVVVQGSSVAVDVLFNDTPSQAAIDPATVTVVSFPANGLVTNIDLGTGFVTYQHNGSAALADSFTYTVDDVLGGTSDPATVRVSVTPLPPGEFLSDDFNTCGLDPIWTFVNSQSDASAPVIQGAFSGDAKVAITVPGGTSHELLDGVIGVPYIIQSTTDVDFNLVVKFDSVMPNLSFAEQGIIVRESDSRWLRLEYYTQNNNTVTALAANAEVPTNYYYAAETLAGLTADTSPLYMKIQRVGDTWTQSWSTDGITYTDLPSFDYTMTVTGVGVYAGNADPNIPEHTVLVDYFSNSAAPITEPDDTDLNAISVQTVGSGSVGLSPDLPNYNCGDVVLATATPNPGWTFTGWSGDGAGTANPLTITMNGPFNLVANFSGSGNGNIVAANTNGIPGLDAGNSCAEDIPVEITRDGVDLLRSFSLTVGLTNLGLCEGPASITEGTYLSAIGTTTFEVTDNLDGTYLVSGALVGDPCGAVDATGTLFTFDVISAIPTGTGTITISDLILTDCADGGLTAVAGDPADITIDGTIPVNVGDFASAPIEFANPAGNVTGIQLSWTPSFDPKATNTLIYRKSFGFYPAYDDSGGAAPTVPADPVAEGWTLVGTLDPDSAIYADLPDNRDYYYYTVQVVDAFATASPANMSTGDLNYILGDVSDGLDPIGDGDNSVSVPDLTFLGSTYGTQNGFPGYMATMDIGPTDDTTPTGLPVTDNRINFEDLMLFGLNYGKIGSVKSFAPLRFETPTPAARNEVVLRVPLLPANGETFTARLDMQGDGTIQGLQAKLAWNPAVVTPVGVQGGSLLTDQQGQALVLSAAPGLVDVCLIGLRERGISGMGEVAAIRFRVIGDGDPGITIDSIDARGTANEPATVEYRGDDNPTDQAFVPQRNSLLPNYPNPFNPVTTITYDLATQGRARIDIYSVDGRLVRRLVDVVRAPGRYTAPWDGTDNAGRRVSSGTYLYRMEAPGFQQTRRMMLVK